MIAPPVPLKRMTALSVTGAAAPSMIVLAPAIIALAPDEYQIVVVAPGFAARLAIVTASVVVTPGREEVYTVAMDPISSHHKMDIDEMAFPSGELPFFEGRKDGMALSNTTIAIIVGLIIIAAIIVTIVIVVYYRKKKDDETPAPTTTPPSTDATPVQPPPAVTDPVQPSPDTTTGPVAAPYLQLAGRSFSFHRGQDWTWVGFDNTMLKERFTNLEAAAQKCLATPGCLAFVVYRGDVYYRPTAGKEPVIWPFDPMPEEGTYIPQ